MIKIYTHPHFFLKAISLEDAPVELANNLIHYAVRSEYSIMYAPFWTSFKDYNVMLAYYLQGRELFYFSLVWGLRSK